MTDLEVVLVNIEGSVKFFSYRSAIARQVFLELPREACHDLEKNLAEKAGVHPDNHTVYAVSYHNFGGGEIVTYIMFSDLKVYFGREVEVKNW